MRLQHALAHVQQLNIQLAPQLQQGVQMLQWSALELTCFLQEACESNPLIELHFQEPIGYRRSKLNKADGASDVLDRVTARDETLEKHLLRQIRLSDIPDEYMGVIRYLAGNLDENGYLAVDSAHVGSVFRQPLEHVERALGYLQSFEPAGVGARSLKECLQLQIERACNPIHGAYDIVTSHLNDASKGKLDHIARKLNMSRQEVASALDYIRSLNPRPGLSFASDHDVRPPDYVKPDAVIQRKADHTYAVRLNERDVPHIIIDQEYLQILHGTADADLQSYVRQKAKEARWLQQNLEKRKITIFKVVSAIASEQSEFLEHGISALKPMNLKALSEVLHMHPSTISRAIRNKSIETPQGVFDMKFFFSAAISTAVGETKSAEAVKARIKAMIAAEDSRKPLSDQNITDILKTEGIHISRRTVMKYRESMKLLSSFQRSGS